MILWNILQNLKIYQYIFSIFFLFSLNLYTFTENYQFDAHKPFICALKCLFNITLEPLLFFNLPTFLQTMMNKKSCCFNKLWFCSHLYVHIVYVPTGKLTVAFGLNTKISLYLGTQKYLQNGTGASGLCHAHEQVSSKFSPCGSVYKFFGAL